LLTPGEKISLAADINVRNCLRFLRKSSQVFLTINGCPFFSLNVLRKTPVSGLITGKQIMQHANKYDDIFKFKIFASKPVVNDI
jgi:hypothetical protein